MVHSALKNLFFCSFILLLLVFENSGKHLQECQSCFQIPFKRHSILAILRLQKMNKMYWESAHIHLFPQVIKWAASASSHKHKQSLEKAGLLLILHLTVKFGVYFQFCFPSFCVGSLRTSGSVFALLTIIMSNTSNKNISAWSVVASSRWVLCTSSGQPLICWHKFCLLHSAHLQFPFFLLYFLLLPIYMR